MKERIVQALRNKKGTAILWGILVCIILMIFVFAIMSISASFHQKSLNNTRRTQAYFTARSAAEALAVKICAGYNELVPPTIGETVEVKGADFPVEMGTCKATVLRESQDKLRITAVGEYATQTQSVSVLLQSRKIESPIVGNGLYVGGSLFNSNKLVIKGDLFLDATANGGRTTDLRVEVAQGNVYSLVDINLSKDCKVNGDIYCTGNVDLKNGCTVSGNIYAKSITVGNNANVSKSNVGYCEKLNDPKNKITHELFSGVKELMPELKWPKVEYDFPNSAIQIETTEALYEDLPKEEPSLPGIEIPSGLNIDATAQAQYYYIKNGGNLRFMILDINITGNNPVYIAIQNGITLNFFNLKNPDGAPIFFVPEDNATLELPAATTLSPVYKINVYGTNKSILNSTKSKVEGVIFTGKLNLKQDFEISVPPKGEGGGGGGTVADGWIISKYERGDQ